MRRAIDTAPKDGKFVILEDGESGSFELAKWSAEARAWVRENGEPSKITPVYWHRTPRDDYLQQEGDEFILQKESGSKGPSALSTAHPLRRDDFLVQEGDEFDLQKQGGSSGPSAPRESRSFAFASGQAPQRPVTRAAGSTVRQFTKPDPLTVARLEARALQDRSERGLPAAPARSWFAVSSIGAAAVAASLVGLYFHAELAAYVTRYTGEVDNVRISKVGEGVVEQGTQVPRQGSQNAAQAKQGSEAQQLLEKERHRADALANELARAQQVVETQMALANKARDEAAQLSQSAESGMGELRQSLQKERERADALAGELAKARRDSTAQQALPSKARDQAAQLKQATEKVTEELRQSLKREHDRAEALASELSMARTAVFAYEAQARKTSDRAADLKQSAESAALELQKPLQQERERAALLEQDLVAARRDVETQVALSRKRAEEVAQLQQATERATAELQQLLQKERDRTETLSSELARAQQDTRTQLVLSSKAGDEAAQVTKAAESTTAELRQSLKTEHNRAEALARELATARTTISTYEAQAREVSDQAANVKQSAESAALELQKPLQQERERAALLEQDLAAARRDVEMQMALSGKRAEEVAQLQQATERATAELQQLLLKERDRIKGLSSELATAQQDSNRQLALSSKAGEEAAQATKAAESTTAELRESLKTEHDRADALASELATARATISTYETQARKSSDQAADLKQSMQSAALELQKVLQQERERAARLEQDLAAARRDVEAQVALSSKRAEEVAQLKQAADTAKADLRLALQQESDRAPIREPTQPTIGARNVVERAPNSQVPQAIQTVRTAITEQPAVAEAQGSPEAVRLLARAGALLRQGDIGAARIVLERAVETGSAQASFMLAETYDPLVLSTWKTYGTRGDVTKARELYAKALAGGIQEAKDRSVALR